VWRRNTDRPEGALKRARAAHPAFTWWLIAEI
jgi:hypothetical protein